MLFSQSRLWLLCLVRLRTTCNSHCTDREKAIWLRATNNRSDANCQSVMFLLTIVQLLCVPTGANCTMPLNFFPHLLYQTMGTLVCAVWGTGSLWCVVTESLLCWPIEPGSTSVLLIEETSGQQLCNDKAIRWGHLLVWVAGPMQKKSPIQSHNDCDYLATFWHWMSRERKTISLSAWNKKEQNGRQDQISTFSILQINLLLIYTYLIFQSTAIALRISSREPCIISL